MRRILLVLGLLFQFVQGEAQVIHWKKAATQLPIGLATQFLIDSTGALQISDVSSSHYQNKFTPSKQSILHFGFTNKIVWLRFEIENISEDSLVLNLEQAFLTTAVLYHLDEQYHWNQISSGYKIPLPDKPIVNHFQVFPIKQKSALYYLRIEPLMHTIPIKLMSQKYWDLQDGRQKMTYGIYAGILMFAIIINFFLFIALKKLYFLNYAILVFFYLLTSALVMEGYAVYFFPNIDLMFWYKVIPVLDMSGFVFYCISFFELKKEQPKLFQFCLISATFFIVYLFILSYLPLLVVIQLNQIFALFVFVLGIYIGITVNKAGNKLGNLFALFYSFWFMLILIEAIYIQTGKPEHATYISYVSTAIFIEAFLLAFLQAKRFEWEKNAAHLLQFEMKAKIEKMEQEFQKEILNTKLEIQDQTFNTVSQEIHDNVGQLLSLAKVQVNIINEKQTKDIDTLEHLKENLSLAMFELRNIAKNLNSHYILNNSLNETIMNQVQRINHMGWIHISLAVIGTERQIDNQKKLVLYRIVQESIQNIIKHANASEVEISLDYSAPMFCIMIADNGSGFDTSSLVSQKNGLGLLNISNRAELIGGKAIIESDLNKGTVIKISAPYF